MKFDYSPRRLVEQDPARREADVDRVVEFRFSWCSDTQLAQVEPTHILDLDYRAHLLQLLLEGLLQLLPKVNLVLQPDHVTLNIQLNPEARLLGPRFLSLFHLGAELLHLRLVFPFLGHH
jgi:hypothetical protein